MNKLSIIFVAVLLGCSKPKQPTPSTKQPITARWGTIGQGGLNLVRLNTDSKTIPIGTQFDLKPGDKITYIIEAKGTKVVFKVFDNFNNKVVFADSNQWTFNGIFIY